MGELVYLWELDSVRNSEEECRIARKVLYDTLLVEGKTVIMTFNQFADGKWILPILKDEDNYQHLLRLFQIGAIRLSRYKNIRTASQYIQNSLEKALQKNNDFIFSGLNIKKGERYIIQEVLEAIRYSNPERLLEDMNRLQELHDNVNSFLSDPKNIEAIRGKQNGLRYWKENFHNKKADVPFDIQVCRFYESKGVLQIPEIFKTRLRYEINRLQILYRYVKLILLFSEKKTYDNRATTQSAKYEDIMDYILDEKTVRALSHEGLCYEKLYTRAVRDMRRVKTQVECQNHIMSKKKILNNRSEWHNLIKQKRKKDGDELKELLDLEVMLIDICYNYTLESSIDGIECTFDKVVDGKRTDFVKDLANRVNEYCNRYFLQGDNLRKVNNKKEDLDWGRLAEIREDVCKLDNKSGKTKNNMSWPQKVKKTQTRAPIKIFVWSVILFIIVNFAGEFFYNIIKIIITPVWSILGNQFELAIEKFAHSYPDLVNLFESILREGRQLIYDMGKVRIIVLPTGTVIDLNITELLIKIVREANLFENMLKIIIVGLLVSVIQKKKNLSDILDIVTNWLRKWKNWGKFKSMSKKYKDPETKKQNQKK